MMLQRFPRKIEIVHNECIRVGDHTPGTRKSVSSTHSTLARLAFRAALGGGSSSLGFDVFSSGS